jgi:hypothetical protein
MGKRVYINSAATKLLMMKIQQVLFFMVMLGLSACQWGDTKTQKADITTDTLTYVYHTKKIRADDCGNKADSACTVVKIKYPVFNRDSILNDTVTNKLIVLFTAEKPDKNLTAFIKRFMDNYQDFKKSDPRSGMFFTLDSYARLIRQDSSLTTLEVGGYNFQGGAHGASATTFINWNTKSRKNIRLNDILIDGYTDKLTKVADSLFRQQEKLSYTASLKDNYFFKNDVFALNTNFLITPLGLRFLYNQYEIKPYAAGKTDLFIPYTKIKSLLRPNTVIAQYLK